MRFLASKARYFKRSLLSVMVSGLVAGTLFAYGLPSYILPFILLPLVYAIAKRNSKPEPTIRDKVYILMAFFVPYHLMVYGWFLDVETSGLIGVSQAEATAAAWISLSILSLVLSLAMLPIGFVLFINRAKMSSRFRNLQLLLGMPALWVCSEWLRSVTFSAFLYGKGASLGDYWNFGSLGLAAMNGPFAPLSSFIGLYGLSYLTVFVAVLLYIFLVNKQFTRLAVILMVLVSAAYLMTNMHTEESSSQTKFQASVLQEKSNAPELGYDTPIQNYLPSKKSLIVLPEYSSAFEPGFELFNKDFVADRLSPNGTSISVNKGFTDERYGTLVIRSNSGAILDTQTKALLIPTGEYLPSILTAFYTVTRQTDVIDYFTEVREVHKGNPPKTFRTQELTIGPVACSGILGRNIFRQLTLDGAEVLTNSASLLDFNHSKSYFRQSLQMARFHSIANNRAYIQSTVGAAAFVFDARGKFIVQPESNDTRFIDFEFSVPRGKTIYTKFGEWPLVLSGIFIGSLLLNGIRRRD